MATSSTSSAPGAAARRSSSRQARAGRLHRTRCPLPVVSAQKWRRTRGCAHTTARDSGLAIGVRPAPSPRDNGTRTSCTHCSRERTNRAPMYSSVQSYGGLIAMSYAKHYPGDTAGLVFVDSDNACKCVFPDIEPAEFDLASVTFGARPVVVLREFSPMDPIWRGGRRTAWLSRRQRARRVRRAATTRCRGNSCRDRGGEKRWKAAPVRADGAAGSRRQVRIIPRDRGPSAVDGDLTCRARALATRLTLQSSSLLLGSSNAIAPTGCSGLGMRGSRTNVSVGGSSSRKSPQRLRSRNSPFSQHRSQICDAAGARSKNC